MSDSVCVRIAPSPTGDPHVGTAYIALFNWMFARRAGGRFLLRIEDTDRARYSASSEAQILAALRWLGLDWDEGPDCGGPHGPYHQSQRTELYRRHADALLETGRAYRCFCTPERLRQVREQRAREKVFGGYDRACRSLTAAQTNERQARGEPFTVRLAAPLSGDVAWRDLIRGVVRWPYAEVDDQILLKSDGFPTYHLANVVDDRDMGVTHVIRAEEWISSTAKHLLLYECFGWPAPEFAHMPLLRNADGSKISKRKNPCSLLHYQDLGVLPAAMLNFLALQGWSMPREARAREEDLEVFTRDEMLAHFDLGRVSKSAPVFDVRKLAALNGKHLRLLAPADFERALRGHLDHWLPRMLPFLQTRMELLNDWLRYAGFLFAEPGDVDPGALGAAGESAALADLLEALGERLDAHEPWTADALEAVLFAGADAAPLPRKRVFGAIRAALTGAAATPPLHQCLAALDRFRATSRLRAAARVLRGRVPAAEERLQALAREGLAGCWQQFEERLVADGLADAKALDKQKKPRQDLLRTLEQELLRAARPFFAEPFRRAAEGDRDSASTDR